MNWKWMIAAAAVGTLTACDVDKVPSGGPSYVPPPSPAVTGATTPAAPIDETATKLANAAAESQLAKAAAAAAPNGAAIAKSTESSPTQVVTVSSSASFDDVVDKLEDVADRYDGYELSSVMDAREVADDADIDMGKTKVFALENATLTAPLMKLSPSIALELPIRILVYEQGGETHVAYHDPKGFATSHGVSEIDGNITALSVATRNIVREVVGDSAVLGDMHQRATVPRIAPSGEFGAHEFEHDPTGDTPHSSSAVSDY